jgi:hypothetical protein
MNQLDSLLEAMFLQIGEKHKVQLVNNLSLRKIVCASQSGAPLASSPMMASKK